jgi:hypothetical protein
MNANQATPVAGVPMPAWARDLIAQYESDAANQFILYGNVNDRLLLPTPPAGEIGTLTDFLLRVLLARFDVILSYDLGNGIRIEKGGPIFSQWPYFKDNPDFPRAPRQAVETLTRYFRYTANLAKLGHGRVQVGCFIKAADLVAPNVGGGVAYDLSALALLMRDWSADSLLTGHALATFLVTENLNDLHPLLVNNTRAARVKIELPTTDGLRTAFSLCLGRYPTALRAYAHNLDVPAAQLAGATLSSIEALLKEKEHAHTPLCDADLMDLKKALVEGDCNGLIEFIEPKRTLDDLAGQHAIKAWLRQDFQLWKQNDLRALPMGYLLCGPVGTGKTFMVECLAGEAGVPVVKLKNFRDKWVGSTEGNLEKIFRLVRALGRCYVFVDEADQSLGKRDSGNDDGGLSGRIYAMIAAEMSDTGNRGKILWVLASSRPDLIEVDLKRPGRIDVKIPIFPTTTPEESFALLQGLCKRRELILDDAAFEALKPDLPLLLTPGAAESLVVKVYRLVGTQHLSPADALRECLHTYQPPVAPEVMQFQIGLAIQEASDLSFVPPVFQPGKKG